MKELNSRLLKATINGDLDKAREVLSEGADVNARDDDGRPVLSWAAYKGRDEITNLLIAGGAHLSGRDKNGKTALHWAAWSGHVEIVNLLLRAGAEPGARDLHNTTPLHFAARNGSTEVILALLTAHDEVDVAEDSGATPLAFAVHNGHERAMKVLLSAGANVRIKWGGRPLLSVAVADGFLKGVVSLVKEGADPNERETSGAAAFDWAKKHPEIMEVLRAREEKDDFEKVSSSGKSRMKKRV